MRFDAFALNLELAGEIASAPRSALAGVDAYGLPHVVTRCGDLRDFVTAMYPSSAFLSCAGCLQLWCGVQVGEHIWGTHGQ